MAKLKIFVINVTVEIKFHFPYVHLCLGAGSQLCILYNYVSWLCAGEVTRGEALVEGTVR